MTRALIGLGYGNEDLNKVSLEFNDSVVIPGGVLSDKYYGLRPGNDRVNFDGYEDCVRVGVIRIDDMLDLVALTYAVDVLGWVDEIVLCVGDEPVTVRDQLPSGKSLAVKPMSMLEDMEWQSSLLHYSQTQSISPVYKDVEVRDLSWMIEKALGAAVVHTLKNM